MTHTTQDEALSPDQFDILNWLGGVNYPKKITEIFREGQDLMEMAELYQFVQDNKERASILAQNKKNLLGLSRSIVDDEPDSESDELLALIENAQNKADEIFDKLKGTGTKFVIQGISPGEREVISKKLARKLKPLAENRVNEEGEIVEYAHEGGDAHPEYNKLLAQEFASKGIIGVIGSDGTTVVPVSLSPDKIEKMRLTLLQPEYTRIINTVYEVNYIAYSIDSKVTVDFS